MVYINGQMAVFIKEPGTKIKFQSMENILGMMEGHTRDTGWIIICMAKEYTNGPTVENMKEIM